MTRLAFAANALVMSGVLLCGGICRAEPFVIVKEGEAACDIVVDTRGSTVSAPAVQEKAGNARTKKRVFYFALQPFARWLSENVQKSTGRALPILVDETPTRPAIIISLAENYRKIAEAAGLDFAARQKNPIKYYDAFCIVSTRERLYLLGHTELACRQAAATLLNRLGYRFFSSSPRWWIVPETKTLTVDLKMNHVPVFFDMSVATKRGYDLNAGSCGSGVIMWERGHVFSMANHATQPMHFSSTHRVFIGPCTGRIILSNKEAFDSHPEYYALLASGERNSEGNPYRRRLCLSNPDVLELVTQDRIRKLRENRKVDRFAAMITIEQTAGEPCQCPKCTDEPPEDVLFRFVNAVAKAMKKEIPDGALGIRAAKPPSFNVEPNVFAGTRIGFLKQWREKATMLGIEPIAGFGGGVRLGPARLVPGVPVGEQNSPYDSYRRMLETCRKYNAISTSVGHSSFFGCHTPQTYIALRMIWNPDADVPALLAEFYELCFKKAAPTMKELLQERYGQARPPMSDAEILSWCRLLDKAYDMEQNADVRKRIVDLMGYMHYLILLHEFDEVRAREGSRNDAYYDALQKLMKYAASKERYRMMFNAGSLAYDFCKKLAEQDGRMDMHWHRLLKEKKDPIWMDPKFPMRAGYEFRHIGDKEVLASYDDAGVIETFKADMVRLAESAEGR